MKRSRLLTIAGCLAVALCATPAAAAVWNTGDLFVGVSSGRYFVYDNTGAFKEAITDPMASGFTTGCAFNPPLTLLYTTNFSATKVYAFDDVHPHNVLQTIDTNATSPGGHSESIVFAANGDFFVGHPDGNDWIHHYSSAGVLLNTYAVAVDFRGTDWIDLAANQTTLYYTSEGRAIQVYDILLGQQPNFAILPGAGNAFALRLLPPGDGTGGLLVADGSNVKRLDGAGNVAQTYDAPGENAWFALNLDPDGTSFWSGDFGTSNFYKFDIATGNVLVGPINTGTGGSTLFGICLKGEPTAAIPGLRKDITSGPDLDGDDEIDVVVEVGKYESTVYDFKISYSGPPALVEDTVPAEWRVFDLTPPECNATAQGANKKNNNKSATKIAWYPDADCSMLTVWAQTRQRPNRKFAPTSCGALYLNDGALAFELDPDTGEPLVDEFGNRLPPIFESNVLCLAAVEDVDGDGMIAYDGTGDEDGDGLSDFDEACVLGTDPCEFTTCIGLEDVCIDADGIATAGRGLPGAGEVWVGQPLTSWPQGVRWIEGIDWFDNDGTCTWTFGDDIHLEDPQGACTTGFRDGFHDKNATYQDCAVLDLDASFFDGQQVDVDLETGTTFTGCPGVDPLLKFYDGLVPNGRWDNGEDIVLDANNNGVFD